MRSASPFLTDGDSLSENRVFGFFPEAYAGNPDQTTVESVMQPIHWVLVLVVVLVLFGTQKLPELARSLGQSAKILKKK